MSVLFIGKRFYTNRDALREHYGRIYQLPWHWSRAGVATKLWLIDYHTCETVRERDASLDILSTPVRNLAVFRHWLSGTFTRNDEPHTVVASGDCYVGLMALRIARRLHARLVFDVYDKYDEFGGYGKLPGFDPFRFLLRRADARLFASRALMEQVGHHSQRDCLVPNGVDAQAFRPLDKYASRDALGLARDAIFAGYFGSMDADRGIDDLMGAVQLLRDSGSPVQLLLAGKPRRGLNLQRAGVCYLGNLRYADVPVALACCDVLVLPYRRAPYLDMASSCKIAEYMAMQRPLVATRTPNIAENFPSQTAQLGELMAAPGDPADLARAIRSQCSALRVVTMPEGADWASIATETWCFLRALAERDASRSLA